jgi:hypothetical protein
VARQSRFKRPDEVTENEWAYLQARDPAGAAAQRARIEAILRRYDKATRAMHRAFQDGIHEWMGDRERRTRHVGRSLEMPQRRAQRDLARAAASLRLLMAAGASARPLPMSAPLPDAEAALAQPLSDMAAAAVDLYEAWSRSLSDDEILDLRDLILGQAPPRRRRGRPVARARRTTEAGLRKAGVSAFHTRELLSALGFLDE